jgi:hypothetical protein
MCVTISAFRLGSIQWRWTAGRHHSDYLSLLNDGANLQTRRRSRITNFDHDRLSIYALRLMTCHRLFGFGFHHQNRRMPKPFPGGISKAFCRGKNRDCANLVCLNFALQIFQTLELRKCHRVQRGQRREDAALCRDDGRLNFRHAFYYPSREAGNKAYRLVESATRCSPTKTCCADPERPRTLGAPPCSWPATSPRTSPAPTSSSMEAGSRPRPTSSASAPTNALSLMDKKQELEEFLHHFR